MMRAARGVVQVAFSEYLKIRSNDASVLVFEGKQCPVFYFGKFGGILGGKSVRQLIARGKRNVLDLRDLIKRNVSTSGDKVVYFVDKDFDLEPKPGDFSDIYVTRGYSIENEFFCWSAVEGFVRANFDIADASDEAALVEIKDLFHRSVEGYIKAAFDLHKVVYICRRNSVRCMPGEDIGSFFRFDWASIKFDAAYHDMGSLLSLLDVPESDRASVEAAFPLDSSFENLDPFMDWRGKFHFSFLRIWLLSLAGARVKGVAPFARSARIAVDPAHPSLLGVFSGYVGAPPCLDPFMKSSPLVS